MKTRRLVLTALLTACALAVNLAESALPMPAPGIKLGAANVFSLAALVLMGAREAFAVTLLRVSLAWLATGNVFALFCGLAGGLAAAVGVGKAAVLIAVYKLRAAPLNDACAENIDIIRAVRIVPDGLCGQLQPAVLRKHKLGLRFPQAQIIRPSIGQTQQDEPASALIADAYSAGAHRLFKAVKAYAALSGSYALPRRIGVGGIVPVEARDEPPAALPALRGRCRKQLVQRCGVGLFRCLGRESLEAVGLREEHAAVPGELPSAVREGYGRPRRETQTVLRGRHKLRSARKYALPAQDYPVKLRALRHGDGADGHKLHTVRTAAERGSGIGADGKEQQRRERREHP